MPAKSYTDRCPRVMYAVRLTNESDAMVFMQPKRIHYQQLLVARVSTKT